MIKSYKVIYIDEFFIEDIADMMILKIFFNTIAKFNNVLFLTSNFSPIEIYSKNIKSNSRELISDLLLKNSKVILLDNEIDYRKNNILNKNFIFKTGVDGYDFLYNNYILINELLTPTTESIEINNRIIYLIAKSNQSMWITFSNLCETHRSYLDYIVIAERFEIIYLQGIPKFIIKGDNMHIDKEKDILRRFISFIDEAYEKAITLYASFECDIYDLVETDDVKIKSLFIRTQSRLFEMMNNYGINSNDK